MTHDDRPRSARRARHQHDPHAVDGRGPEGELRAPRHADGARADRLRALHARDAHNPSDPTGPTATASSSRAGHASMLLYSMLYLTGYGLTLDDLKNFRQLGTPTAGHPEHGDAAGHRDHHRPARPGHLERRRHGARASACWPRASTAPTTSRRPPHVRDRLRRRHAGGRRRRGVARSPATSGLGRLIAFYDDNHISIEGDTELSFTEDVGKRYEAYGWHVQNLARTSTLDRIEQRRSTSAKARRGPARR